ncbi:MAG TPA: hypothetical protein VMU57_02795 [Edaphobacter sp.]|uniref:hypothetical protein n=1 Tax=Edaphobacter sp. TaxID=1934404 RepID=UPI002B7643C7|nr:hypothetical protein [Edaphobacter sp.]HUZ93818.1 hypothetical protein [Edaphobacter sp.]
MRIAIVVNDVERESPLYTTILVACAVRERGHFVYFVNVADMLWDDSGVTLRARQVRSHGPLTSEALLQEIQGASVEIERLSASDIDLLWLRNEPSFEALGRPWAQYIPFQFAQALKDEGVCVVSEPASLSRAVADKLYSQKFPASVRPKTIVTRHLDDVIDLWSEHIGDLIMKPLHGGAGRSVFLLRDGYEPNLEQIFEAVSESGYVVVQHYVPEANLGSIRLFMLDGKILSMDGKPAALLHLPKEGELRSNFRVSGKIAPAILTDEVLAIAQIVGPILEADGLFLVGLDIAGGKLLEANVFSPGGLRGAERMQGVPFSQVVADALERKLHIS